MTTQTCRIASGINPVNAAETIIVTSDSVPYNSPAGEGLMITGMLNVNTGATTTAVVVTVRKGNALTGAIVGAVRTHNIGAAANANIPFAELDTAPANPAQYVVTYTGTGASSNATVYGLITTNPVSSVPG